MPRTSSVPEAIKNTEFRDLGDEALFYDRDRDRVHVLNETAREIFLFCDGRRTEEEVARALADRYAIDIDLALRDTLATLDQLRSLGLIRDRT